MEDSSPSKVPAITLAFWAIKILATTLGETAGDAVSMSLNLGYAISSIIFIGLFALSVAAQIRAKKFYPYLYWAVIIATTTAGTTMADFADRSLGIGYAGGSAMLFALLMLSLLLWRKICGSVAVDSVNNPKSEMFYWLTVMFSQTLGTALGDWIADTNGFGYENGALVFAGALAIVTGLFYFTKISRVVLFWVAFILTRPLGATIGDYLDKPLNNGGLAISRFEASFLLFAVIVILIAILPQKSGKHPNSERTEQI